MERMAIELPYDWGNVSVPPGKRMPASPTSGQGNAHAPCHRRCGKIGKLNHLDLVLLKDFERPCSGLDTLDTLDTNVFLFYGTCIPYGFQCHRAVCDQHDQRNLRRGLTIDIHETISRSFQRYPLVNVYITMV